MLVSARAKRIAWGITYAVLSIAFVVFFVAFMSALGGCKRYIKPTPPAAAPNAMCFVACTPSLTDTGERWDCDPEDPACWDVLANGVIPALRLRLTTCEMRRQECAGFIGNLYDRDIIRNKETP